MEKSSFGIFTGAVSQIELTVRIGVSCGGSCAFFLVVDPFIEWNAMAMEEKWKPRSGHLGSARTGGEAGIPETVSSEVVRRYNPLAATPLETRKQSRA